MVAPYELKILVFRPYSCTMQDTFWRRVFPLCHRSFWVVINFRQSRVLRLTATCIIATWVRLVVWLLRLKLIALQTTAHSSLHSYNYILLVPRTIICCGLPVPLYSIHNCCAYTLWQCPQLWLYAHPAPPPTWLLQLAIHSWGQKSSKPAEWTRLRHAMHNMAAPEFILALVNFALLV